MIILRDSTLVPADCFGSVMALGNFDGLHLGHQAVIAKTIALAKQLGKPAALMTFEPHPRRIFRPDLETLRLLPFNEKARKLQDMGIDFMRVIRFTRRFSRTTAEGFIAGILQEQLRVSHVITGEDFIFGHNREGNASYLRQRAAQYGFAATACKPVIIDGERCSSTRIRALLGEGKVREAARLFGRSYSITGRVRSGDKRGQKLGFPTANIWPARIFTPANGVYAVRANLRGREVDGVANLGTRPTFGGERLQLEAHFFDWDKAIYNERIEVVFIERIREERKFDGAESLKKQIVEDVRKAKTILADA